LNDERVPKHIRGRWSTTQYRLVAAFDPEELGMRATRARSHAPVDTPDVVARRIRARLGVLHALAARREAAARFARVVVEREDPAHRTAEMPQAEQLVARGPHAARHAPGQRRVHYGTGTRASRRSIRSLGRTLSARA
jgi:hypothetical protein